MDDATAPTSSSTTHFEVPSALCDVRAAVAEAATVSAGVLWRLTETGRQLDANLVQLGPRESIGSHAEPDLDVPAVRGLRGRQPRHRP
jgi:hypothetical protein